MTQQQAVKIQLEAYKHVLMLLRTGDTKECEGIVGLLRTGDTLEESVVDVGQVWTRKKGRENELGVGVVRPVQSFAPQHGQVAGTRQPPQHYRRYPHAVLISSVAWITSRQL
jgi:hypothetical protein